MKRSKHAVRKGWSCAYTLYKKRISCRQRSESPVLIDAVQSSLLSPHATAHITPIELDDVTECHLFGD